MNDTSSSDLISFSGPSQARNLEEMFDSIPVGFAVYMDEAVHCDPNKPLGPEGAGKDDGMQTPPKPHPGQSEPPDESYVKELYSAARTFFGKYIQLCRSYVARLTSTIDGLLAADPWPRGDFGRTRRELAQAEKAHARARDSLRNYAEDNRPKVRNATIEPPRHSALIFASWVFFIAVFEFVWVWFFLSEQLGIAGAIYVSAVASTLVVLIAALCAFAQSNCAVDLDRTWRLTGFAGVLFCLLLFLFGIGLLSGWRADSTQEGMAMVIGGYRSLTKIDVFVTAVLNLVGFIFLTREFKLFFWPYPLYYYAERKKKVKDAEAIVKAKRAEASALLARARNEAVAHKGQVQSVLGELSRLRTNLGSRIRDAALELDQVVASFQGRYSKVNLEYRTRDAYAAPAWLEKCSFSVFDGHTAQAPDELQAELQRDYAEYEQKCQQYFLEVEKALEEIKAAAREIGLAAGDAESGEFIELEVEQAGREVQVAPSR